MALSLFGEIRVVNDLGGVDTSSDFWNVSGHVGAVVDAEASSLAGTFYASPYAVRLSNDDVPFDGRIFTTAYGDITDARTRNSGSLLIVR